MENEKNESIETTEPDLQEITSDSKGYTVDTSVTKDDWVADVKAGPLTPDPIISDIDMSKLKNRLRVFFGGASADRLVYVKANDGYAVVGFKPQSTDTAGSVDLVIPDEIRDLPVVAINSKAFQGNEYLRSVIIPESVVSIGDSVFFCCSSLTSVTIPYSVVSIGNLVFSGCSRLTNITVSADNEYYKSIDGNLYTKDGKTLVQYARGKTGTSFTIPEGVVSIGHWAFYACSGLTSVTIPEDVTSIGVGAFYWCTGLTSVTIPEGVTRIGYEAFYYCSSLSTIYYKGTAEEWSSISISDSNSELTSATRYYYSENEPTESGRFWHYVDGVPTKW